MGCFTFFKGIINSLSALVLFVFRVTGQETTKAALALGDVCNTGPIPATGYDDEDKIKIAITFRVRAAPLIIKSETSCSLPMVY